MRMMMGFAKLDSGIIHSSIWGEELFIRVVWITLLALKDEHGFVSASVSGIQRASNVTMDECVRALDKLQSPDPDSRTKDYEGQRIEKIDGGWIVLNNDKYRQHSDIAKKKTNERVRRFREKQNETQCNVTETLCNVTETLRNVTETLPSVSVSVSESVSVLKEESRETFLAEVANFIQYPEEMRTAFIDYWTETNRTGKKMRFQMERTWDTSKRLSRWAQNDKTFKSKIQYSKQEYKQDNNDAPMLEL